MKQRGQDAPSYSEAQATAWLAWLARGMQQHGQTVFLIEQLQPSWLSTRGQCWGYIFASRLIWGILIAMIVGLVARLVLGPLLLSLLPELIIIIGLILGLIDAVRFGRNRSWAARNASVTPRQILRGSIPFVLIVGLIYGLLYGLYYGAGGLTGGLVVGVEIALIAGLIGGPILGVPQFRARSPERNPDCGSGTLLLGIHSERTA